MDPDDPDSDPDFDDSDCEGFARRPALPNRRVIVFVSSGSRHSRLNIPIITGAFIAQRSNNKYPDVENFHGIDKDRHIWDFWQMHLESKFMQSWELFEIEVSKILYIRDYCKEVVYNVIKARADLKNPDHYVVADDMI